MTPPAPSHPVGRPRSLDASRKSMIVSAIAGGATLKEAAEAAACNRDTILVERRRDAVFDRAIKLAKRSFRHESQREALAPLDVPRGGAKWKVAARLVLERDRARSSQRIAASPAPPATDFFPARPRTDS